MGKITIDDILYKIEEINSFLGIKYRMGHPKEERDWRTYEHEFSTRIKAAMKDLDPLMQEAVSTIHITHGPGHPYSPSLDQMTKLLLIKHLVGESNRMLANVLDIFSMLSGIDVSYKSVERLYSDEEVKMAIHNLHVLIPKMKGIKRSDTTGGSTGNSLTVKKNYESHPQHLKDKAKENRDYGSDNKESKGTRKDCLHIPLP